MLTKCKTNQVCPNFYDSYYFSTNRQIDALLCAVHLNAFTVYPE